MSNSVNPPVEATMDSGSDPSLALTAPSPISLPPAPRRALYKPLSAGDPFSAVMRVARWLRAGVDDATLPPEDAAILLAEIWEPLTRENPAERSISPAAIEHLNRMVTAYLPLDLNDKYQLARVYAPSPEERFELACLAVQAPRMTLAITRLPRRRSRARRIDVEMDENGGLRRMRPDPTRGIRRMFQDPEGARAELQEFVRLAFEIDRRRCALD